MYERLAGRTIDVHVYGVPDDVPEQLDVTVHRGTSDEYRNSWCVVFQPPDDGDGDGDGDDAALLAHQREANRWWGFWTYDPEMVTRVDGYLDRSF